LNLLTPRAGSDPARWEAVYGKWPISFEVNRGNYIGKILVVRTYSDPDTGNQLGSPIVTNVTPLVWDSMHVVYSLSWDTREAPASDCLATLAVQAYEQADDTEPLLVDQVTVRVRNVHDVGNPTVTDAAAPARFWTGDLTLCDLQSPCSDCPAVNSKNLQPRTYGAYCSPEDEISSPHAGLDLNAALGVNTPVLAPCDGWVVYSEEAEHQTLEYGLLVIRLDVNANGVADDNVYGAFQHLSDILVSAGDTVAVGNQVGLAGDIGTGSVHIHYELAYLASPPSTHNGYFTGRQGLQMYPYYRWLYVGQLPEWNSGLDVRFVEEVSSDGLKVTAAAYGLEGGAPQELTDTTGFDPDMVRIFYRAQGTLNWTSATMTEVTPYHYEFTWPTSLHGPFEYFIRARRAGEAAGAETDTYHNYCFYPPRQERPEPWPNLVPSYPYGLLLEDNVNPGQ